MNWKAQTLPVILKGLPPATNAVEDDKSTIDWTALPQPSAIEIERCSALAQVKRGNYTTPTFLVHGTADELIPWQQSHRTWRALADRGIEAGLALVEGAPHICDTSHDPESADWKAVLQGYDFLAQALECGERQPSQ
jgi:dipeptidyl aminopeptidase/acylaminoacyl peptidase